MHKPLSLVLVMVVCTAAANHRLQCLYKSVTAVPIRSFTSGIKRDNIDQKGSSEKKDKELDEYDKQLKELEKELMFSKVGIGVGLTALAISYYFSKQFQEISILLGLSGFSWSRTHSSLRNTKLKKALRQIKLEKKAKRNTKLKKALRQIELEEEIKREK